MTSATMHNQRTQRFNVMDKLLFALSAAAVKHQISARQWENLAVCMV